MSDEGRRAKAVSVRARLLNIAREQKRPFDLLVQRYAIERLLYRLARSSHADTFILKGAMVFLAWGVDLPRPTRDLELMGFVSPDTNLLVRIFAEIAALAVEEDGLLFDSAHVTAEQIREEDVYSGVRVKIPVLLGTMKIILQVDVGVGDSLVPEPETNTFPSLLGNQPPVLRTYSRYVVVAEKYEAMVKLGEVNSRMKDFYDLWLMAGMFDFDPTLLREAITNTFAQRQTPLPVSRPQALMPAFHGNPIKQQQWKAFTLKAKLIGDAPHLPEVCEVIWRLVSQK